jgi:hypothetical protein
VRSRLRIVRVEHMDEVLREALAIPNPEDFLARLPRLPPSSEPPTLPPAPSMAP